MYLIQIVLKNEKKKQLKKLYVYSKKRDLKLLQVILQLKFLIHI
jgi:hypothetical protein